jgi:sugar phosphate isomerase/epimerase
MKTAVTLCRVTEAATGPFVFHDKLPLGFAKAVQHGFTAVELFLPDADAVSIDEIKQLQAQHSLEIAAIGTGAGMVKHGLSLTDADPAVRKKALDFILALVDFGAEFSAPAILGSMQGKYGGSVGKEQALTYLAESLRIIGCHAKARGVTFLYEPLNRYETNLLNTIGDAAAFIQSRQLDNIKILADLFHMNIEEKSLELAIADNIEAIGHIHFADSNRRAIGFGHTDPIPLLLLLHQLQYQGYLSAEILPLPSAEEAAAQFILSTQL